MDKGCYQNFICYQDQICLYDSGNTLIAIISYTISGNILHWEISSVEWKKEYGSPKEIGEGNLDITEFLDKEE